MTPSFARPALRLLFFMTCTLCCLSPWATPARADVDDKFDYQGKKRHLKVCLESSAGCPAGMEDSLKAAIALWNAKTVSWQLTYTTTCGSADIKVKCASIKGLGSWTHTGSYGAATGSEITINKDADWGWCDDKHEVVDALVHELGHAMRLNDNNKPADSMNGERGKAGHKRAPGARDSTEAATSDTSTVKTVDTVPPGGKKLQVYSGVVTPTAGGDPLNLLSALQVTVQAYRPASLQILGWNIVGPDQIHWEAMVGPDADGTEAFFVVITYPDDVVVIRQGFLYVTDDPVWDHAWRPVAIAPADTVVPGPSSLVILDARRSHHPGGFNVMRFSWLIDGMRTVKGQWETAVTLLPGEHEIVLKALDSMGWESTDNMHVSVGPGVDAPAVPRHGNYLDRNQPNPFNPSTIIRYGIATPAHVILRVYDVAGRPVRTLVNEAQSATAHQVVWDGRNERGEEMPAGLYVYRIEAGTFTQSQKMVLLK